MTLVNDMLEIQKNLLADAAEVCCSLPVEIGKFDAVVSSLPYEMVKLRLIVIQGLIRAGENALRVLHGDKGFVFIQASQNLLNLRWSELDFLEGQKASLSSGESVFIAPDVVVDKIEGLLSQVDSGELVAAVNWLNRYDCVHVEGISRLPWTSSYDERDTGTLDVTTEIEESGKHCVHGESPVYMVSLAGHRPKSLGNVKPYTKIFMGFSKFLLLNTGNLRRMLIKYLSRMKYLFSHMSKLTK